MVVQQEFRPRGTAALLDYYPGGAFGVTQRRPRRSVLRKLLAVLGSKKKRKPSRRTGNVSQQALRPFGWPPDPRATQRAARVRWLASRQPVLQISRAPRLAGRRLVRF
eukprot:TRINITY_DN10396_c0_g1_i1.p1 TRINITY_DN10396_c0_g1~~TRINITY_DN10396_c0_g1_i1.p1  ORF type:complete len:124 (+),score=16.02 TRINITY_DN10396_c0_g1_i1:51-374(+)